MKPIFNDIKSPRHCRQVWTVLYWFSLWTLFLSLLFLLFLYLIIFYMVVAACVIFFYFTCKFSLFVSVLKRFIFDGSFSQQWAGGSGRTQSNCLQHWIRSVTCDTSRDSHRFYPTLLDISEFPFFSKLHWTNSTQREFSPSKRNARPMSLPRKAFPKHVRCLISLSNAVKSDRSWSNYACIIFHGLCLFPVFLLITIASGIGTKILKICLRHIFGVDHDV